MRRILANERGRLEDTNLIVIGGGYLARVCGTVQAADANVIVYGTRYDLHSFERAGQYDDVASGSIRLNDSQTETRGRQRYTTKTNGQTYGEWYALDAADGEAPVTGITRSAQYLMAVHVVRVRVDWSTRTWPRRTDGARRCSTENDFRVVVVVRPSPNARQQRRLHAIGRDAGDFRVPRRSPSVV